ncbi:CoA transferase [Halobacteriales archaeon QS_3_64_16]|nr:MAG: CoA transferase [Halobacteriales archaeon QS_3_64_16]
MTATERTGPLDGLRVVDCSGMIGGGFATTQLADFGADVVMVEHPEQGDPLREWPPFDDEVSETSLWWKSIGRNKRCVTLDLSSEEGAALLTELIAEADLFFENFRPGTMEGWGLGPDALREVNEELIYVRVSGYGQTGPRSRLLPPISLADLTAAQFAVQASLFAIFERDVGRGGSGEGQVIDVSLYEPLFRLFLGDVEAYDRNGRVPTRTGNRHPNAAPRNVYATANGYITLSASSQRIFENVATAIDRPDLAAAERFATNDRRVENAKALDAIVEAWTSERDTETVIREMEASDAIVGPVYDMSDIFADEQYQAREDVVAIEDPELGELRTAAPVPKFSRTPGEVEHVGPRHGQHNEEVYLEEIGLDRSEYERLRSEGII